MTPELAIVGAGYVGLPLARCFAEAGVGVVLVDIDGERVEAINRGDSYVEDVPSETLRPLVEAGALSATSDYDAVRETDAIVIALPTPLSANREPDLSILLGAIANVAARLREGTPRLPRVDDLSRDDARGGPAASRDLRPRGRR